MIRTELLGELAGLEWLQPSERIDRFANDFLRRFRGDRFDLHAAFGAGDNQRRRGRAIEQDRKINLARDIGRLRDEDFVDDSPAGPV